MHKISTLFWNLNFLKQHSISQATLLTFDFFTSFSLFNSKQTIIWNATRIRNKLSSRTPVFIYSLFIFFIYQFRKITTTLQVEVIHQEGAVITILIPMAVIITQMTMDRRITTAVPHLSTLLLLDHRRRLPPVLLQMEKENSCKRS